MSSPQLDAGRVPPRDRPAVLTHAEPAPAASACAAPIGIRAATLVRVGVDPGHGAVDVVGSPDRARAEGDVRDAHADVDRARDGTWPRLDSPHDALLLRRDPDLASAHRDRGARFRADADLLADPVRAGVDLRDDRPLEEPDPLRAGGDLVGVDVDRRYQLAGAGIDPGDGVVGVERPDRARPDGDIGEAPVERGGQRAARPVRQLDRTGDRAGLGVDARNADGEVSGKIGGNAAVPEPQRSLAGRDIGRHAACLEPPGDCLRPRVEARHRLVLRVQHPNGARAHGDIARGFGDSTNEATVPFAGPTTATPFPTGARRAFPSPPVSATIAATHAEASTSSATASNRAPPAPRAPCDTAGDARRAANVECRSGGLDQLGAARRALILGLG